MMWFQWGILAPTLLLLLVLTFLYVDRFRAAKASWRLLSLSGWFLSAFGLVWILRAWNPTPGPYRISEVYPFGNHLQAWQVTFGFTWLAFGFLFFIAVLSAASRPSRLAWVTLLASWLVCMLPHVAIAIALAWAGVGTIETVDLSKRLPVETQPVLIAATAAVAFLFFSSSLGGFLWTAWQLRHGPSPHAADAQSASLPSWMGRARR